MKNKAEDKIVSLYSVEDLRNKYVFACHGGGLYKGTLWSNCKESFYYWYKKGVRFFEFDIGVTSDNLFVLIAHKVDKHYLNHKEVYDESADYSYDWFLKQNLYPVRTKGLTPLSLKDCISLLKEYSDCIFMLDCYGFVEENEILKQFTLELNKFIEGDSSVYKRLLVEMYTPKDLIQLYNYNQSKRLQCIYAVRSDFNTESGNSVSVSFLKENDVKIVSYPWKYHSKFPNEMEQYISNNIMVFSLTNLCSKKRLKKVGVTVNCCNAFYSDCKKISNLALIVFEY